MWPPIRGSNRSFRNQGAVPAPRDGVRRIRIVRWARGIVDPGATLQQAFDQALCVTK